MKRIFDPRNALDFPRLERSLFVIWTNGERPTWPDARRSVNYLSARKKHTLRGWALFTFLYEGAATFKTETDAREWLAANEALRGTPYGATVSTVAELIRDQFNNGEILES